MEIITPRLILRPPVMEDADDFTRAKQEVWQELQKWMSWAADGQETLEATHEFFANWNQSVLLGFCRESGKFVVSTGLNPVQGHANEYETGYWVAKNFLGKGYATEATNAVIRHAFLRQKAKAVHIGYFDGNDKSRNIIDKLGFTPVGAKDKKHQRFSDGALLDEYLYIMRDMDGLPPLDVRWGLG